MNKKEAENIAWELTKLEEAFLAEGSDASMLVANQARDTIDNISKHPKIANALRQWKSK